MVAPLQAGLPGPGLVALVVTALVTWLFYAVTLHLAATFFIGDVPTQPAAAAAVAPAVVSLLLQQYAGSGLLILVSVVATVAVDFAAVSYAYRLEWRSTAPLVALHVAFATILGYALNNIFGFV
ncbi:DUF7473 family protein [Halomicrobium urmianum]|uniref:DUF7473 family protein n=1 Tax=Halomicrobium urmianum TaxID=1586233 RepID=UPI001CD93E6F|nr:hypothetical protein [Halomicrobium urmianum]